MFISHSYRQLWLAFAGVALLTVAGCSNQATNEAGTAPKPEATKPAAAPGKPAAAVAKKTTATKPAAAANKATTSAAKKSPAPKSGAASGKAPQSAALITVPKGTAISATVGQTLASNKSHAGDSFAATLAAPVKVGGKTVIPKGAHLTGRVVAAKKRNPAELTVTLASIEVHGKSYPLQTNSIAQSTDSSKAPAKKDVKESDSAKAKPKKDLTLQANSNLKFKLVKSVKLPAKG